MGIKSLVDKCTCGGNHIVLFCPTKRVQTQGIFYKMRHTDNPVTKSVYREILIKRFSNGDY